MRKLQKYVLPAIVLCLQSIMSLAGIELDKPAPTFSLKDVNGKEYKLVDFRSKKAVVLMFIATQCPYSNAYNERMEKLYADYKDKDVVILGINSNKTEPIPEMIEHAKKHGLTFPLLKDEGNVVADQYEAEFTPEIFVADSKLIVRYHGRIDNSHKLNEVHTHDLRNALDAILAGKAVPRKETKAFGCTIKRVK